MNMHMRACVPQVQRFGVRKDRWVFTIVKQILKPFCRAKLQKLFTVYRTAKSF